MNCILNNTELKDTICDICSKNVLSCLRESQAENKRLREVLKWYGNENLYWPKTLMGENIECPDIDDDKGEKARKVLKDIEC